MTADDLDEYLVSLGLTVEVISDAQGTRYSVIRDFEIPAGGLCGKRCDIALVRATAMPYVMASAIHTRPPLVAMNTAEPLATQPSPTLGAEWQYWSRRYDHEVTPQRIWAHVLTVLGADGLAAV
jgi:hypothetical protein